MPEWTRTTMFFFSFVFLDNFLLGGWAEGAFGGIRSLTRFNEMMMLCVLGLFFVAQINLFDVDVLFMQLFLMAILCHFGGDFGLHKGHLWT